MPLKGRGNRLCGIKTNQDQVTKLDMGVHCLRSQGLLTCHRDSVEPYNPSEIIYCCGTDTEQDIYPGTHYQICFTLFELRPVFCSLKCWSHTKIIMSQQSLHTLHHSNLDLMSGWSSNIIYHKLSYLLLLIYVNSSLNYAAEVTSFFFRVIISWSSWVG